MTLLRINAADFVVRGTEEQLGKYLEDIRIKTLSSFLPCSVFGDIQLLVNIGGYLGLFIGLSLNDLFGYSWDLIVAAVSRRRKHKIGKFSE